MTERVSREIRLVSRPTGLPTAANFALARTEVKPPQAGGVLVRNLFMSVDPYMRGRMNDRASYVPAFELDQALDGGAVGEVVESRDVGLRPGDVVTSNRGWREYFVARPEDLHRVERAVKPLSLHLGVLGMTGMTAWVGLQVGKIGGADIVFVSGAAGAVGNVAGQLARLRGCRVIGSAGSDEKVKILRETCGFAAAFNYRSAPLLDQLRNEAPDGIDVYFDNVGGETLEAALAALRAHGRVVACGAISGYNEANPAPGPRNLSSVIAKRLTITGLIVSDWLEHQADFESEMRSYLAAGKVKPLETVVKGIDQAVTAFIGLFAGRNVGKMIVDLT